MIGLKELLLGYCDPQQLAISERPIGDNGLTRRIAHIATQWEISVAVRRKQYWQFGHHHFPDVFGTFVASTDTNWITEVLRIMDRPRTRRGRRVVENLTVELCHERFQTEPKITALHKQEENRLYDALMLAYDNAGLRQFRNQQMFHLDLADVLASRTKTGNILAITQRLVEWFAFVGTVYYGTEPLVVTRAHTWGKKTAREFRKMMTARLRELVGRPKKTKARFKTAGWNALHAMATNSANESSAG